MGNRFDEKVAAKNSSNIKSIIFFGCAMIIAAIGVARGASPIEPISFKMKPMPDLEWDERLGKASRILEDPFVGPSAMAFKRFDEEAIDPEDLLEDEVPRTPRVGDYMFTGLKNGTILQVELATGQTEKILENIGSDAKYLHSGWKCGQRFTERVCGRSMDIAFDQDNLRLLALDAWKGLYSIDLEEKTKLPLMLEDPEGNSFTHLHGMAVSRHTGKVYFTEPSSKLDPSYLRAGILEGAPAGRLYMYDPMEGSVTLLATKLYFPTGVAILENKEGTADEAVLMAETSRARIRRFNIPKKAGGKGSTGIFAEQLPGLPLSLQWDHKRRELVVGCEARTWMIDTFARIPHVRAFLGTVQGWFYDMFFPRKAALLTLDRKGNVRKTMRDPTPQLNGFSQMRVYKNSLFIGSDTQAFVAKLDDFN